MSAKKKSGGKSFTMNARVAEILGNAVQTRAKIIQGLLCPGRDLDKECHYPLQVGIEDYSRAFERGDIAVRVVSLYPEECWANDPEVYETEDQKETAFETAWDELQKKHHFYSMLQRADMLSGIGRFGVILLGLDDGGALNTAVPGINEKGETEGEPKQFKLIYLRTFDESVVRVKSLQSDNTNPRYGLPTYYAVQFSEDTMQGGTVTMDIHWTRIIHLCDNRRNSDIFGMPRMQKVYNRLLDLQKVMGGSAEMFWKGGFPGYALESAPGLDATNFDLDYESVKKEMDEYQNGLSRFLAVVGMQVKSLVPQIADPTPQMECQIRLISIAMSVPWRILMGVEVGQLAGEQDMRVWNRRLAKRQNEYLNSFVISPFIDRLIAFGVLPPVGEEGYRIEWPDLNTPSDLDKAGVAEKQTNALTKYVASGAAAVMPLFQFLTLILDFSDEEAQAVEDAAHDQMDETDPLGVPEPDVIPDPNADPSIDPNAPPEDGPPPQQAPKAKAPAKAAPAPRAKPSAK